MALKELENALAKGKTVYFIGYKDSSDALHIAESEGRMFYTDFQEANAAKQKYAEKNAELEVRLHKILSREVKVSK